jgi:iron complex outermembrane recepter protein
MQIRYLLAASVAALSTGGFSATALAQSTGTVDFEDEPVLVVTGTRTVDVAGVQAPDTSKAKAVLTQELIEKQSPGQTILDTINLVPGVSFQNNDAYGSSGGTLSIRGFDSTRISLTFDGVPLNDSGSYSIFSNQQLDPELIEQVNVNLGSTDVDSPTASAVGGTVNYRTMIPTKDFGVKLSGSAGDFDFMRVFGVINTGELNSSGTRAFISASRATNNAPFNGYGRVNKQQYNARIYQPIGTDGDFVSIAGNLNQNRNNFFGSLPLRFDAGRVVGVNANTNRFPTNAGERRYGINAPCLDTIVPVAGTAQAASTCGTEFDRRYNPSNTGNIRGASKFSIGEKLTLTIDPSYQLVKANGGGTTSAREARRDTDPTGGTANCTTVTTGAGVLCSPSYLANTAFVGRDLNGDGDILDQVTVLAPSQTNTRRIGLISSLRFEINDSNTIRVAYTYDGARHRQTGEVGRLLGNGEPVDVFPVNEPLRDSNGAILQKRDRLSYAILHQVAGEYRGEFFDKALTLNLGVRAPFFRRNLNNNCFTTSAGGNLDCFGTGGTIPTNYATLNPTAAAPQKRVFDYNKILPNVGFTYKFGENYSVFGSFAQGLSVPSTDNLYNAFFFAPTNARARPNPETTDSFDLGLRYRSGKIQMQAAAWYTKFQNRLASSYDPELDQNVFRNLGDVQKYGMDGSIAFELAPELSLYLFGSWQKSKIKDNIAFGENTDGTPIFAPIAGKQESGSPIYSFGGSASAKLGPVDLNITGKRTGPRYVYDTNEPIYSGTFIPTGAVPTGALGAPSRTTIFGRQAPAYWLVNLNANLNLDFLGLNDKTKFRMDVYNLFDNFYVGGFGGGLNQPLSNAGYNRVTGVATYGNPSFVQIGAPRTVSGTVTFAF